MRKQRRQLVDAKHLLFATLFCVALSTVAVARLQSAPKPRTATASVIVSPSPYKSGEPLSITGLHFTAMALVYVDVQGPSSFSTSVYADKFGKFSISYAAGLSLAPGSYVITAEQPWGVSATTGLEAQ